MLASIRSRISQKGIWASAIFLLLCFYMLQPVNFYLAESIKNSYYMLLAPVLVYIALTSAFERVMEFKLLLVYLIWVWISRVLNGDPALQDDYVFVVDLALMLPAFALGLALTAKERQRFFNWLSIVAGVFYFMLGLIALTAFLQRRMYLNPITEGSLGIVASQNYARINIFDIHPNTTGCWFLISFFLLIYQFFSCRKKIWRVPIVLCALVDWAVIAITYSRSIRLSLAAALALTAFVLVYRRSFRSKLLHAFVILLVFCSIFAGAYKLSGLTADVMATLSYSITGTQPSAEDTSDPEASMMASSAKADAKSFSLALSSRQNGEADSAVPLSSGGLVHSDPRPQSGSMQSLSSGRTVIWRSAFQALRVDPSVLWKGKLLKDTMTIANTFTVGARTGGTPVHFHNSLLQVLMTLGLPGLLLVLAFLSFLFVHLLRFCLDRRAPLAAQLLALPVACMLPHFMLEANLFTICDLRTLFYFLFSGMALGFAREYYAAKTD